MGPTPLHNSVKLTTGIIAQRNVHSKQVQSVFTPKISIKFVKAGPDKVTGHG